MRSRRTSAIGARPTERDAAPPHAAVRRSAGRSGAAIAVALIVPLLLGAGVHALLHTSPIGVLIGLLVGIAASCYTAYSRFRPYL